MGELHEQVKFDLEAAPSPPQEKEVGPLYEPLARPDLDVSEQVSALLLERMRRSCAKVKEA